ICAGSTAPSLCRPRGSKSRGGQRGARTALVPGQEGGLVCGARRPADAGDQHLVRSSPQRHRAETLRDEGGSIIQVTANRPFSRGWPTCITWCRISAGPRIRVSVAWKLLNLHILTSGGLQCTAATLHH